MKRRYSTVTASEFNILVEGMCRYIGRNNAALRKVKRTGILYGVAILLSMRIISKQEEAICKLSKRLENLERQWNRYGSGPEGEKQM